MPGGKGRGPVTGPGCAVVWFSSGCRAFLRGVAARRAGRGMGSQPYLGPRGVSDRPGDMMIDWVSPPAGKFAERVQRMHELVHALRAEGRGLRGDRPPPGSWGLNTVQRYDRVSRCRDLHEIGPDPDPEFNRH